MSGSVARNDLLRKMTCNLRQRATEPLIELRNRANKWLCCARCATERNALLRKMTCNLRHIPGEGGWESRELFQKTELGDLMPYLTGYFPQKRSVTSGCFAENDLQLR